MPVVSGISSTAGPCEPYVTAAELVADPRACNIVDGATADTIAAEASATLYRMLGFQFPGVCTTTVRPVADCYPYYGYSGLNNRDMGYVGTFGWFVGCDCRSSLDLVAPIVEIAAVKVDGVTLNYSTGWVVENHATLVRVDGGTWPRNQNRWIPDNLPNTFSITYSFGTPIPALIREAALEMAVELWLNRSTRTANRLPQATTSVNRQGMTLAVDKTSDKENAGSALVALAMQVYNPTGARNLSQVWSPDQEWTLYQVGPN